MDDMMLLDLEAEAPAPLPVPMPEPETAKAPARFKSAEQRDALAMRVVGMIDAARESTQEEFAVYKLAQEVYDDETTPTSIVWDDTFKPYNVPLTSVRVDQVVGGVVGAFDRAAPFFVLSGGDESEREAAEQDLHDELREAGIGEVARQCGYSAAIWARGPFRVFYERSDDALNPSGHEGVRFEAIDPQDFVVYPSWVRSIDRALFVGDRFSLTAGEIKDLQKNKDWFADRDPQPGLDDTSAEAQRRAIADLPDDEAVELYQGIVHYEGARYLVVIDYNGHQLLDARDWPKDLRPWYFAPALIPPRPNRFWPKRSVASRAIEVQAISNDAYSAWVLGMARAANPTILATGLAGDQKPVPIGIGNIVGLRGNPQFTTLPSPDSPSSAPALAQQMERSADGITRASQLAAGQQLAGDATATEAAALSAGATAGITEYRLVFMSEFEAAAEYALRLMAHNFGRWSAARGISARCQSPDWLARPYSVELNSKSAYSSPQTTVQAVQALAQMAQGLQIPIAPGTRIIQGDQLMQIAMDALPLNNNDKLFVEQPEQIDPLAGIGPEPTGAPAGLPADIPPELLDALVNAGPAMPPEGVPLPPEGVGPVDPALMSLG